MTEVKARRIELDYLRSQNELLRAALEDIIERWPTERGMDGAIQRARALLMEYNLRHPTKEDLHSALIKDTIT